MKHLSEIDKKLRELHFQRIRQMSYFELTDILLFPQSWDETFVECVKEKLLTLLQN